MEPAPILVRYGAWATLQKEVREQLTHGGLFLRSDLQLPQFSPVRLFVVAPDGAKFELPGEVVTAIPGQATAVQLLPAASDAKAALVAHAATGAAEQAIPDGDPVVARADDLELADEEENAEADVDDATLEFPDRRSLQDQLDAMSIQEKRQMAMHGRKDQRLLLIRDHNKAIHPFVLKNPAITLEEIEQIAKLTSVNPDVLHQIAHAKEWLRSATVIRNLVRNPKTPVPDAVLLVDKLAQTDLRAIVKSGSIRTPIQAAARKKLIPV